MAKRLYKSTTDKKIDGVIGGIAEYFDVDSTILRLAFVFLTIFSLGLPGLVFYVVASIIMPTEPTKKS